jgi:hypothetical protein
MQQSAIVAEPGAMTSPAPSKKSRRLRLAATLAVLAVVVWTMHRSSQVSEPALYSAGVAIGAHGQRVILPADGPKVPLLTESRVLASAGAAGQVRAAEQRTWLDAGTIPSSPREHQDMVRTALLDLHTLLLPDGAAVAGWTQSWRYVWPRDASMIAVALSRTGHQKDALSVMQFLQRQLPVNGVFQARYQPDGSGAPDARGEQTDGTGWVLWAAAQIVDDLPTGAERSEFLAQLRPLIERTTHAALRLTNRPNGLPDPSADYLEVKNDRRLSLGTAAPLAFGLEAATKLQLALGDAALANATKARASVLRASITTRFGAQDYPRYLGGYSSDATIAFLLPPFTVQADPKVVAAWRSAAAQMRRPAGGIGLGAADWKHDGTSWTAQTALFALTAASIGDPSRARSWLSWLSQHRTQYGALPEKVLNNGKPAGPAPLAWTGAFVLLAMDALARNANTSADWRDLAHGRPVGPR